MNGDRKKHTCPVCWHEETMIARDHHREPIRDQMLDVCTMEFVAPYGGARGQQCTRWDQGSYVCALCGARFNERDLHIMLDAVGISCQANAAHHVRDERSAT